MSRRQSGSMVSSGLNKYAMPWSNGTGRFPSFQTPIERAVEFDAMVNGTGAVGPRNWRGHLMRARTELWARNLIMRIRAGEAHAGPGSP
jgi:hypothetical protein